MYSQTPTGKAPKGSVQVISSNGRLQLRFRYGGKRHYLSIGLPDSPENLKAAELKARQIELDIASGNFDPTLAKYKPESLLSTDSPDITPKATPKLLALWQQYVEARKTGKSPSTLRMYGWVANHLERCPHNNLDEAQAVFDWLTANVPAGSAKRLMMHLSACCRWARKSDLIDSDPFDGMAAEIKVQKAGTEEEEVNPFTRQERDRIIAAFKADRYYQHYAPIVEFLFFTGCRPSEAIALQWQQVTPQTITFAQAVVTDERHRPTLKTGLKTQKKRKFPVNTQLAALLSDIQPEPVDSEALVFPSPKHHFIDWHNFTTRAWAKVLSQLPDIEYRNPYQTRHTFCSLCREADISSLQIAKWVGNSAQMIDRIYAKPTDHIQVPEL